MNSFKEFLSENLNQNKKYKPKNFNELRNLCNDLSVNLGDIDTSLITYMGYLFYKGKRTKNEQFEGINTWNTSKVTDMIGMFRDVSFFNQPLDKWDTSKVTSMDSMFKNCTSFNQPLNSWNTSKVTNMYGMFYNAKSFNQPLNKWNTSNVDNMSHQFNGAEKFNQNIKNWNINKVDSFCDTFHKCPISDKFKPDFPKEEIDNYDPEYPYDGYWND